MANVVYTSYLTHLLSGTINLATDPIYAMLVSGSYVADAGHSLVASATPYETVDTAGSPVYVAGGSLLTGKTITVIGSEVVFDAANISWTPSTMTASGVVLWASGAGASNHHLISWTELGTTSSTNGTFQIVWSATDGIFKVGVT